MRTVGSNTLRGGQTVFHGLRMWGQLLQAGMFLAAIAVVAFPAWNVARQTDGYDWYAALMVTVAEAKLVLGYEETSGQEVRMRDGRYEVMSIRDLAASTGALRTRERLRDQVFASAFVGAQASAAAIGLFLALFWIRGRQLNRAKWLRGAELASVGELARRVRPLHRRARDAVFKRPAPYTIAGVPYPARAETRHTIVSGTTGSGKTVLISDLVAQIRERGERCVLYDKMGSYTRSFFDPARDVLLNPLDARSPRWSPFHEARSSRDFDTMAAALIPQQKDTVDPFWVTAARQLFSNGAGVLREKGVTENRVLVDHLLKTELTALAQAMEDTVAQSIVDPENPKTALSVRAMLTAHLGALEVLPDDGTPFSIRDWISDEKRGGFLFLTSRADQHASLRGLISTWLEIAVNALLSLDQDDGRRVWIVLDELPTLHQVPSLQPGLAESRQFGGCFVLGIQVISALRDLYGRNGAETVSGLCGTRVVLSAPDEDTARWSAASLGRAEVEEVTEGFSYGANTIRDGVSLTPKRELRPLALASEIMQLPALHGYLRFPGPLPAARIALDYVSRDAVAERFVARRDTPETQPPSPTADPDGSASDGGGVEGVVEVAKKTAPDEPAWLGEAEDAADNPPDGAPA
ncbi:MAG: type IV secretion system DNA-binding domain-containing protein [Rhodospirillaceae bacterium]|nr:type IV secretion system DNA-binding domain-containing protein [Rhodospirillaceae bacterium]